jgi:hypothetical protein
VCVNECADNQVKDACLWNQYPPAWSCKDVPPPAVAGEKCTVTDNVLQFPMVINGEVTNNSKPVSGYDVYTVVNIGDKFGCKLSNCKTDGFTNNKVGSGWCLPSDNGSECDPKTITEHDPSDNHTRPDPFGTFTKAYTGELGQTIQCNFSKCSSSDYIIDQNKCVKKVTPCTNPKDPNATQFDKNCKIVGCRKNYTPSEDGTTCILTKCDNDNTFTYKIVDNKCVKSGCMEPYLKLNGDKCEVDCTDKAAIGYFIYGNPEWGNIPSCSFNNIKVQASSDKRKCILKPVPKPTDEQKIFGYCGNSKNCPQYAMSHDKQRCETTFMSYRAAWKSGMVYNDVSTPGCLECPPLYCKPGTTKETAGVPGNCINLISGCDYTADTPGKGAVDSCKRDHTRTNPAQYEIPGYEGSTWSNYKSTGLNLDIGNKQVIKVGGYNMVSRPSKKVRFYVDKNSKGKEPTVHIYDEVGKEASSWIIKKNGDMCSFNGGVCVKYVTMDNEGSFTLLHDNDFSHALHITMPDLIKQVNDGKCKSSDPSVDINVHTWLTEKHKRPGWKLDKCV